MEVGSLQRADTGPEFPPYSAEKNLSLTMRKDRSGLIASLGLA